MKKPNNYLVSFGLSDTISYLLLCYNSNGKFCFIDLKSGKIFDNTLFNTVDEAENWLFSIAKVYTKNKIETTYIP